MWDERLTTVEASRRSRESGSRADLDSLAEQLSQSYGGARMDDAALDMLARQFHDHDQVEIGALDAGGGQLLGVVVGDQVPGVQALRIIENIEVAAPVRANLVT